MSDRKVYDAGEGAQIAFQKLSPKQGDVILVRMPDDVAYEQMYAVAQMLTPLKEKFGCDVVMTTDAIDVEMFTENAMNELGWYRLKEATDLN